MGQEESKPELSEEHKHFRDFIVNSGKLQFYGIKEKFFGELYYEDNCLTFKKFKYRIIKFHDYYELIKNDNLYINFVGSFNGDTYYLRFAIVKNGPIDSCTYEEHSANRKRICDIYTIEGTPGKN
jgi:hypothetical protein